MNTVENSTVALLRRPRSALVLLLLGAVACGGDDDTTGTDDARTTLDMAGASSDAGKTAAPSSSGPDAGTNSADGGNAANGDAGAATTADAATEGAPIDVSEARIAKVLHDFCTAEFTCDPEEAVDAYTDLDTCVFEQRTYIDDDLVGSGAACGSAELDFNTCYAATGCDTDPEVVCEEQFFQMLRVCD